MFFQDNSERKQIRLVLKLFVVLFLGKVLWRHVSNVVCICLIVPDWLVNVVFYLIFFFVELVFICIKVLNLFLLPPWIWYKYNIKILTENHNRIFEFLLLLHIEKNSVRFFGSRIAVLLNKPNFKVLYRLITAAVSRVMQSKDYWLAICNHS